MSELICRQDANLLTQKYKQDIGKKFRIEVIEIINRKIKQGNDNCTLLIPLNILKIDLTNIEEELDNEGYDVGYNDMFLRITWKEKKSFSFINFIKNKFLNT